MKPALLILFIAYLLSLVTPAPAQEPPEQPRYYDIEIIVFARDAEGVEDTEYWPPLDELPDWSQTVSLQGAGAAEKQIAGLPPSGHRLTKEYRNLRAARGRLRPLLHLAWRQPVLSGEESTPIYIRSLQGFEQADAVGAETYPELEGTVRVTGKRYLHVHLDLLLRQLTPPDLTTDATGEYLEPGDLAPYYQTYRLVDHRRMRSDRLHYVDHPKLGVLVLATPYEVEASEPPDPPRADVGPTRQTTGSADTPPGAAPTADRPRNPLPVPSGGT